MVGQSETIKSQLNYSWLKIGTFQTKFNKIYFFRQHLQSLYDVMQKVIEISSLIKTLNLLIDWKTTVQNIC